MKKDLVQSKVWKFVDAMSLSKISLGLAILTLMPAGLYSYLSEHVDGSYIGTLGHPSNSLLDALYFSVITETTLGYGDIAPYGWCRAVACLQVFGGLALAGVAVAKLTSMPNREMRTIAYKALGCWIEPCKMPDARTMIAFVEISASESGILKVSGENYDVDGQPLGNWYANLIDFEGNQLRFKYRNNESNTDYFNEGLITYNFVEDPVADIWIRHHSSCQDFAKNFVVAYEGFRASKEQLSIIKGNDFEKRKIFISKYAASYFSLKRHDAANVNEILREAN